MDFYWPISIFLPKYPVWQDIFGISASLCFFAALLIAWKKKLGLPAMLAIVFGITVSTNLLQGTFEGFIEPVAGEGAHDHQYWQDVDKMTNIPALLASYTKLQPTLQMHSRVHPPGAMILFYFLRQLTPSPLAISLIIGLAGIATAAILHLIIQDSDIDHGGAKFWPVVFALLPSVMIYSIASLDVIIMFLFTLTFWAFRKKGLVFTLLASLGLFSSTFLTFAGILLFPIIIYEAYRNNRTPAEIGLRLALVAVMYLCLYLVFNYDYLESFLVAKSFEGSRGFYALTAPLSYLITRLEDVIEILLFFGPYLTYLLGLGIHSVRTSLHRLHPALSPIIFMTTFAGFLLAGAYFTGETARAAMFIYPFLVLFLVSAPVTPLLNRTDKRFLLIAIFTQSVVMQLFGSYSW